MININCIRLLKDGVGIYNRLKTSTEAPENSQGGKATFLNMKVQQMIKNTYISLNIC